MLREICILCMLLCACTFHVNRLDLCIYISRSLYIFTVTYTYVSERMHFRFVPYAYKTSCLPMLLYVTVSMNFWLVCILPVSIYIYIQPFTYLFT